MNDAQARELLPALATDALPVDERRALLTYMETRPHLQQELSRMNGLFNRIGQGSASPPPEVWGAIEAAIARDVADAKTPRVAVPTPSPRWRQGTPQREAPVADSGVRADLLFGKIALNWKFVTLDLLNRSLHYQRTQAPHLRLGELLLEKGVLTREQVEQILSHQSRISGRITAASAGFALSDTIEQDPLTPPLLPPGVMASIPLNETIEQDPFALPLTPPGGAASIALAETAEGPRTPSSGRVSIAMAETTESPLTPQGGAVAAGAARTQIAIVVGGGDSAESVPDALIGLTIDGCTIKAKIGAGGMGAIYLADHEALRVQVVVKILPPEAASNPRTVERFHREARAAARLEHPNVVSVRDVGTTDKGLHYIIMQYIDGGSLEEQIRDVGKHDLQTTLGILLKISSALQAAHGAGVIHRDLKPDNVLVSASGEVRVADFGLAKDLNSELKLTADGAMIGTPLYMAPEIGRVREIDGRVDIFSLGVTFYYLLTGIQPFRGFSALDILSAKAHDKIAPPETHIPEISPDARAVMGRMLAKDRDVRYGDMGELIADLERLSRGLPVEADPEAGPWAPFNSGGIAVGDEGGSGQTKKVIAVVGAVIGFSLVVGLLIWFASS